VLIRSQPDMDLAGTAKSAEAAVALFLKTCPDITVIDLELVDSTALEAIRRIRLANSNAKLIGLTTCDLDKAGTEAMAAGVLAIVEKDRIGTMLVDLIRHSVRRGR
jgi:two-component system nitrate/nitrite response regulator NarL